MFNEFDLKYDIIFLLLQLDHLRRRNKEKVLDKRNEKKSSALRGLITNC